MLRRRSYEFYSRSLLCAPLFSGIRWVSRAAAPPLSYKERRVLMCVPFFLPPRCKCLPLAQVSFADVIPCKQANHLDFLIRLSFCASLIIVSCTLAFRLCRFPPSHVYRVAADVSEYKHFVPWCLDSRVLCHEVRRLLARLQWRPALIHIAYRRRQRYAHGANRECH